MAVAMINIFAFQTGLAFCDEESAQMLLDYLLYELSSDA
jgi:hypothetical protein